MSNDDLELSHTFDEDDDHASFLQSTGSSSSSSHSSSASNAVCTRSRLLSVAGVAVVLFVTLVVLISVGHASSSDSSSSSSPQTSTSDNGVKWRTDFHTRISTARLKESLATYATRPRVAGTDGDVEAVEFTRAQLESYGLPQVEVFEYRVLLSYPVELSLKLLDANDTSNVLFTANLTEPVVADGTSSHAEVVTGFNAYSHNGSVEGELVYVNYGTIEDYELLHDLGYDLNGKIAIARYGANFRGLKAMIGERYGIKGLIIYSDPIDDGFARAVLDGQPRTAVYPDGKYRPAGGVQRGSAQYISQFSGDPLTPGTGAVPDLPESEREYNLEDSPNIPNIPIIPISHANAEHFLRALAGNATDAAPFEHFQGGLEFTYHIGSVDEPVVVALTTHMDNSLGSIYDVVATIPGTEEPEREILLGNHRDAWVFGAVDAHTGSISLLEVGRALGAMYQEGWRPRRTIRLCSWDAEEYGLIGSVEWVEQHQQEMYDKAVAYFNMDIGCSGDIFRVQAVPSLTKIIEHVAKSVPQPYAEHGSIYDHWGEKEVHALGSGSDYTPFLQFIGVAAGDMRFTSETYGVYHSVYDSIWWVEHFGDPEYKRNKAIATCWGLIALHFADSELLPFDFTDYATALNTYVDDIATQYASHLDAQQPLRDAFQRLRGAIDNFRVAAVQASELSQGNTVPTAVWNDRFMNVERALISEKKLPGREIAWYKHVVYAPSMFGGYSSATLPGIRESLSPINFVDYATVVEFVDDATTHIQAAADTLMPPV